MPLSMMRSVTPIVPANDQMSPVFISSVFHGSDIVQRGVQIRVCRQHSSALSSRRPSDAEESLALLVSHLSSFGNITVSHVPSLAKGTTSRNCGPRKMPAASSPRIAGSVTLRKTRPVPHTPKRKITAPMSRSNETPAILA